MIVLSLLTLAGAIFFLFILAKTPAEDFGWILFGIITLAMAVYWCWALMFSGTLRSELSRQKSYYEKKSLLQRKAFYEDLGEKPEQ